VEADELRQGPLLPEEAVQAAGGEDAGREALPGRAVAERSGVLDRVVRGHPERELLLEDAPRGAGLPGGARLPDAAAGDQDRALHARAFDRLGDRRDLRLEVTDPLG
jgi:hypothetical protein